LRTFRIFFTVSGGGVSIAPPYTGTVGTLEYTLRQEFGEGTHEVVVRLRDRIAAEAGVPVHQGFDAEVDAFGNDLGEARENAHSRLQFVLSLLVLQTNATVGSTELLHGQETTAGADSAEYLHVEQMRGDLYKRQVAFDHDELQRLISGVLGTDASPRIGRATRWYRKGLTEEDSLDRFASYWLGLECLNKLLMDLLGEDAEMRNCKSCGFAYEVPTAKGIRSLFDKYSPSRERDFKRCRNLRVDLQHGSADLTEVIKHAEECAELCRAMLRTALYLLLGFPVSEAVPGPEPTYNLFSPYTEIRTKYDRPPDSLPETPWLTISIIGIKVTDEGGRTTSPRVEVKSVIPPSEYGMVIVAEKARKTAIQADEDNAAPE